MPYIGKNSKKQKTRTKIIWFTYKNFVMCHVDPYCGKKYGRGKELKNLSTCSVLDSATKIDDWSNKEIFFNNWFLSLSLISIFKKHGFDAIGTICANWLKKDLKINKKELKHKERGFIQTFGWLWLFWLFQMSMDPSLWPQLRIGLLK